MRYLAWYNTSLRQAPICKSIAHKKPRISEKCIKYVHSSEIRIFLPPKDIEFVGVCVWVGGGGLKGEGGFRRKK